jgi:hypothetical protein
MEGDVPQRLHSVCVLLWRFPKLEVPFAVSQSVSHSGLSRRVGVRRTHFGLELWTRLSVFGAQRMVGGWEPTS